MHLWSLPSAHDRYLHINPNAKRSYAVCLAGAQKASNQTASQAHSKPYPSCLCWRARRTTTMGSASRPDAAANPKPETQEPEESHRLREEQMEQVGLGTCQYCAGAVRACTSNGPHARIGR